MKIKSISYKIYKEGDTTEIVNQMWDKKGFEKQTNPGFNSLKKWTIDQMEICKKLINEKQNFHYFYCIGN